MNFVATTLTNDHHELDALARRLADDSQAPGPGSLETTWALFETKLSRHMEAEERFLLPLLEASDPAEAARIRLEHARIRNLATELGVNIDLHTARAANVADLVELLREHAQHENAALYRLAGEKASTAVEHGVARMLRRGVALAASVVAAASDHEHRTDEHDRVR